MYFTSLSSPQSHTSFFINQGLPFSSKIISTLTPEPIKQQNIISFVPFSLKQDSIVESKEIPTISTHNRQEHTSIESIAPHMSDQYLETLENNEQPLFTIEKKVATLVEGSVPASSSSLSKASPLDQHQHTHLTAQLQEVEQNFPSLQARHEDLLQELDMLKDRLFIVHNENQALRQIKTTALPLPKVEQPMQGIQGHASSLKENELEQRIRELQVELAVHVNKRKQQARTTQENLELQCRIVELEKRLVDLGRGRPEKEAYVKQLNDTIEQLKNRINSFEQENSRLKEEQAISRATTKDLHQKNFDLDRLLSELYHRISILKSDKKALEQEIVKLNLHIRFLETDEESRKQTESRRTDDNQIPLPLSPAFRVSEPIVVEETKIPASTFSEGPLPDPISNASENERAYLKRLKKLNKMINKLSQQLSDKQTALWSIQDESAEREIKLDELTAKLKCTEKENLELKSKNHHLKNEKADLEQKEKALNEQIMTRDSSLSEFEKQVRKYEKDRIASQDDVSKLNLSLNLLLQDLEKQKNDMEHLKAENHKLSQQNISLTKKRGKLESFARSLSDELEKKIQEISRLKKQTETLEENLNKNLAFSHHLEDNLKECIVSLQMFHVATLITQQRINNQQENLDNIRYISSQWIQEYALSSKNSLEYVNEFIMLVRSTVHPDSERDDQFLTPPTTTPPDNDEEAQPLPTTPASHAPYDEEKEAAG